MDRVIISDLSVETVIGVYDWERLVRQRVLLNVEMGWDNTPAARADDLSLALDYKAVSDRLAEILQERKFQLLETAAEALAACILDDFSVPWVRLKIEKPDAIPAARGVGVVIVRGEPGS